MLPTNKVRIETLNFTADTNAVTNGTSACLPWGGTGGGRGTFYVCPFDMFLEGMVLILDNEAISGFIGSGGTATVSIQTARPSNYATTIVVSETFADTNPCVATTQAEFLSGGTDIGKGIPCFVNNTTFPNSSWPLRLPANTMMSALILFTGTTVLNAEPSIMAWVSQADDFGGSFVAPR